MPSWWMPDSCANALRPTITLLYCTGNEVARGHRAPAPHDVIVVLHRDRSGGRRQLRGAREQRAVDVGPVRQHVVAHLHRHHDLFERGGARALADAVDGARDPAYA